jgi:hypothetical protein
MVKRDARDFQLRYNDTGFRCFEGGIIRLYTEKSEEGDPMSVVNGDLCLTNRVKVHVHCTRPELVDLREFSLIELNSRRANFS